MPLCWKNVAREGGGRIFKVGLFSRDYGIAIFLIMLLMIIWNLDQPVTMKRNGN